MSQDRTNATLDCSEATNKHKFVSIELCIDNSRELVSLLSDHSDDLEFHGVTQIVDNVSIRAVDDGKPAGNASVKFSLVSGCKETGLADPGDAFGFLAQ